MNPVLVEIYSTIVPSMPFIIGAYVLMWLAILVYMLVITLSYKKAEKQMAVLEEAVAELQDGDGFSRRATITEHHGRSAASAALRARYRERYAHEGSHSRCRPRHALPARHEGAAEGNAAGSRPTGHPVRGGGGPRV